MPAVTAAPTDVVVTPATPGPVFRAIGLRLDRGQATTAARTYHYTVTSRVVDRATGRIRAEHVMVSLTPGFPEKHKFVGSAYAGGAGAPAQMWLPDSARGAAWVLNDGESLSGLEGGVPDVVRVLVGLFEAARERAASLAGA